MDLGLKSQKIHKTLLQFTPFSILSLLLTLNYFLEKKILWKSLIMFKKKTLFKLFSDPIKSKKKSPPEPAA
jgi:hypothetical protein